jgi:hypothetical protein
MTLALARDITLEPLTCPNCGLIFAVPKWFELDLRESHRTFWCPSGHSQSFQQKTEAERLRALLDAANRSKTEIAEQNTELMKQRDKAKRQLQRVKRGVCPCCNRTFVELGRHMKTKHPNYAG